MTKRTRKDVVTFRKPFVLDGFDEVLPAGAYSVETDEEQLAGLSFLAYRRTSVVIRLHPDPAHPGRRQTLVVDPNALDAALEHDLMHEDTPNQDSTAGMTVS